MIQKIIKFFSSLLLVIKSNYANYNYVMKMRELEKEIKRLKLTDSKSIERLGLIYKLTKEDKETDIQFLNRILLIIAPKKK